MRAWNKGLNLVRAPKEGSLRRGSELTPEGWVGNTQVKREEQPRWKVKQVQRPCGWFKERQKHREDGRI